MKKCSLIAIGKIVGSITLILLWFAKIFHGTGHLPSQEDPNQIVTVDFYHSMLENITDIGHPFAAYGSIAMLSLSALFALFSLLFSNKKLGAASHIVFGIAVILFLVLLVLASSVARGY